MPLNKTLPDKFHESHGAKIEGAQNPSALLLDFGADMVYMSLKLGITGHYDP